MRFLSGARVPSELLQAAELARGEKVMAWSAIVGGGGALATMADLIVVDRRGRGRRHDWAHLERVVWEPDSSTLAVWWIGRNTPSGLELVDGSRIASIVQDRVRSSIAAIREVELPGGGTAVVVLRRSAHTGLLTQVPPVRGVDLTQPDVAERLRQVQRRLLADAGD